MLVQFSEAFNFMFIPTAQKSWEGVLAKWSAGCDETDGGTNPSLWCVKLQISGLSAETEVGKTCGSLLTNCSQVLGLEIYFSFLHFQALPFSYIVFSIVWSQLEHVVLIIEFYHFQTWWARPKQWTCGAYHSTCQNQLIWANTQLKWFYRWTNICHIWSEHPTHLLIFKIDSSSIGMHWNMITQLVWKCSSNICWSYLAS